MTDILAPPNDILQPFHDPDFITTIIASFFASAIIARLSPGGALTCAFITVIADDHCPDYYHHRGVYIDPRDNPGMRREKI